MFWPRNPSLSLESLDARLRVLEHAPARRFLSPIERAIPREPSVGSLEQALESLRRSIEREQEKQCPMEVSEAAD